MWIREVANGSRGKRAATLALVLATPLAIGACGEDDFPNDPRPAAPIELTAAIDDKAVSVSPSDDFGAGLVNITISNQTDEPTRLTLEGPTTATSGEIVPGGTGSIKTQLDEGEYEAAAGAELGIKPETLTVGPDRPNSTNELLQP
jgi:hypothetical protein